MAVTQIRKRLKNIFYIYLTKTAINIIIKTVLKQSMNKGQTMDKTTKSEYKGHQLLFFEYADNTTSCHAYLNGEFVHGTFSHLDKLNALQKMHSKIDLKLLTNKG